MSDRASWRRLPPVPLMRAGAPWSLASATVLATVLGLVRLLAQPPTPTPIDYTVSFPDPARRFAVVTAVFPAEPGRPLDICMSRTSPGRYAVHDFVKNVFAEEATDGAGRPLTLRRTGLQEWTVDDHDDRVRFSYRVYGDTLDGTYLAIDETHAHMNVPATLVWARGLEGHPARLRLVQPEGRTWQVATQLFPTADPLVFTAPNLAYLIDSPIEFGDTTLRQVTVATREGGPPATIRVALHHQGSDAEATAFLHDVERIVREERAVFGELPAFEPGSYTFIADFVPWANGDGMEHRNSTVLTAPASLATASMNLLDGVAHEFFHAWNVERIRPRSLEPFNLLDASVSGELWLAEGFTNYYGPLAMQRSGLAPIDATLGALSASINAVLQAPGRRWRSVVAMSRLAALVDGARPGDRTVLANTFVSYYTWGSTIALGLDLALRDRSDGRLSLDDYMRALWRRFGAPGGSAPGLVGHPYSGQDLVEVLAGVSGDGRFAEDFFRRYVEGSEVPDYARLLDRAGLRLRPSRPHQPWVGALAVEGQGFGVRVRDQPLDGTPGALAGLAQDDVVVTVGGQPVGSAGDWHAAIGRRRPGDTVPLEVERRGRRIDLSLTVSADPSLEIVPAERAGGGLTPEQEVFRHAWLDSKVAVPAGAR